MNQAEVIIVGGGPAGAACARCLKKENIEVLILDKQAFPRPKTCAGWITPEVFHELGCDPADYPDGIIHFNSFDISIKGLNFRPKVNQYAIRRIEFDNWLLKRSGARFVKHHVKTIQHDGNIYKIDDEFTCKYLIGAGGTNCLVSRTFFNEINQRPKDALIAAMEEEFPYRYTNPRCHLWFFEGRLPGYAWYVPKANGYVNVGVGGKMAKMRAMGMNIRHYWERLVDKLERNGLVNGRSFQPTGCTYYLRQINIQVRNGNAFIIGDAVGLATLDMGEGIRNAISSGIMAAEAIINHTDYSVEKLPKYSFISLLINRG